MKANSANRILAKIGKFGSLILLGLFLVSGLSSVVATAQDSYSNTALDYAFKNNNLTFKGEKLVGDCITSESSAANNVVTSTTVVPIGSTLINVSVYCRVKQSDNTYRNLLGCIYDLNASAGGTRSFACNDESTFKGDVKTLGDLGISSSDKKDLKDKAIADTKELADKNKPNPAGELVRILLDFVSAIVLIFVYLISWFATIVLWLISVVFLIIIQINPASSEFLAVAQEPWQIVVAMANLLILFSFIYLGFAYLLGLKSIVKNNKWETFVTNILIVGITVNLSLFACAALINFTHGIGDTFIGAYAATSSKNKTDAIIGDFMRSIQQVSYIRCGTVNVSGDGTQATTGGTGCDTNWAGESIRLQQTVAGATAVGPNIIAGLFGRKTGFAVAVTASEIVYLVIVIYAILQMWRAMFLALLRVVGLWLLMVVSPLALVAFFSPIDRLKKLATQWWENFSSLAFFYPIFIFGLILVGRISNAFSVAVSKNISTLTASTVGIDGVVVNADAASDTKLVTTLALTVAVGFASVYMLGLLTSGYDSIIKAIKAGIKQATSAVGGFVRGVGDAGRLGARGLGIVAPGLAKGLKLNERFANLTNKRDRKLGAQANRLRRDERDMLGLSAGQKATLLNRADRLDAQVEANRVKRFIKFAGARKKTQENFNNFGDKIEEVTSRDWMAGPNSIKARFAADKKGRLDANKAENDFNREVFLRESGQSELADLDKNAKLRGLGKDDIAELKRRSPNWQKDKVKEIRKQTYANSVGTNAKIPRSSIASVGIKLADKAKGDISNLDASEQDTLIDAVKQGLEIGDVRQEFIANDSMRNVIRNAMDKDNVFDEETKEKIRRKTPYLIGNRNERNTAYTQAGLTEENFREFDGSTLSLDPEGAKAFYEARVSEVGPQQAIKDLTAKGGLRGGFSNFADTSARQKVFEKLGLDEKNPADKDKITQIDALTRQSMARGVDENALIGKAVEEISSGRGFTNGQYALELDKYMEKSFGAKTKEEALDRTILATNLLGAPAVAAGASDEDIVNAIKARGQFKGITVAGSASEQLEVYQAAIARNVETLGSTKEVLGQQYIAVADQVVKESKEASEDNILLKAAQKEAKTVRERFQANPAMAFNDDLVKDQATLEVMNDYTGKITKGAKVKVGVGPEHDLGLTTSDEQNNLKRELNKWAANGFDATEHATLRSQYTAAGNMGVVGFLADLNASNAGVISARQTTLANDIQSQARAKGSSVTPTSDQLAEVFRSLHTGHTDKIKKREEEGKKKTADVHGTVDQLFNRVTA